jgi:hypothetical protein
LTDGGRKVIDGTFIRIPRSSRVRRTGEQIFWRATQDGVTVGRYPIHRLEGPRIEDALNKPEVLPALQKKADDTLQKRLEAEANYILNKART